MDFKRKDQKRRIKPVLAGGTALLVLVVGYFLVSFGPGGYQVQASSLLIGQVKQGDMMVEVQGNGILAPRNATWISSNIDGIVESVKVKPGTAVEPGDLIAELVNPELIQTTKELRWELGAKETENKALKSQQENDYLAAKIAIVKAMQEYRHAKVEYDAAEMLNKRNDGSVPLLVLYRSRLIKNILTLFDQRTLHVLHSEEVVISIDAVQIEQMLINILKNADESMSAPEGAISLSWKKKITNFV